MTRVQRRKCQIEYITFEVQLIVKPLLCASGGHEGSRETGSGCESVRGAASVVSRRTTHSQAHHPPHATLLISVRSDPASSELQVLSSKCMYFSPAQELPAAGFTTATAQLQLIHQHVARRRTRR